VLVESITLALHVAPPSLDEMATPIPTATHLLGDEQLTDLSSGRPVGTVLNDHDSPSLLDVATVPDKLESPPTATHNVVIGQLIASNAPIPSAAPPGTGIDGAPTSFWGVVQGAGVVTDTAEKREPFGVDGDPMASATDANSRPVAAVAKMTGANFVK
jgi:hypothetical protein